MGIQRPMHKLANHVRRKRLDVGVSGYADFGGQRH